jgi:hypothetical protein
MSELALDREELASLRAKYVEMKRLRDAAAAGAQGDPRPAMRALAARFPGALREIDELAIETIEARIASLDRALEEPAAIAPWMIALCRYHALLRIALRIRRDVAERSLGAARDWVRDHAPAAGIDDQLLGALLRPPEGRLSRVVLARVAVELGTTASEIEHALIERRRGSTSTRSPR